MSQQQQLNTAVEPKEEEIDILELVLTLWKQRRKIIKWCAWGALIGLVIAFSIPKSYKATVMLAPEEVNTAQSSGFGALASMVGMSSISTSDAVYPTLYPDVISSVPFVTGLFNIEVETEKKGEKMTLEHYLLHDTRSAWWGYIFALPGKLISLIKGKEEVPADHKLDNFRLTYDEDKLVQVINGLISASVDNKTGVVTIDVQMQDPLVAALTADSVVERLQEFVTDYRTNKARADLDYALKLNEEAKDNYYKAQQAYADYVDRNQSIAFRSAQVTRERLENEASLAFNLYNQTAQQVQKAQAKVQETTPVYAVVSPATVPIKAASPRKLLILIGFVFLAFVACSAWILFIKPFIEQNKLTPDSGNKSEKPADGNND